MGFPLAMFDYQRGSHLVGIITIALNPVRNHHFWSVKPPIHIPFIRLMHRFDAFCIPSTGTPSLSGQLPAEEVRHFAPGARCIAKAILSSGWQKGSKTAPSCRGCRVWFDHFCDFVEAPPTTIFGLPTHPHNPSGWWCVHVFGVRGREKRC